MSGLSLIGFDEDAVEAELELGVKEVFCENPGR